MAVDVDISAAEARANIFVSYSRKDAAFVDRLEAAMKARGFAPKIDRTDIYAFEDWRRRIENLIVEADTIVFVLSPDAVASEVCRWEVGFAAELKKRFAPIVCRATAADDIPPELARLNFVFFDEEAKFEASADKLAEALSTDIDWVRKHTEYGALARRWAQAGRPGPKGLLLRPPALEEAERWIASRPAEAPMPTEATQAFVAESRKGETKRRNGWIAGLSAVVVVALGLLGLAEWQRQRAEQQTIVTRQQTMLAQQKQKEAEQATDQANLRRLEAQKNASVLFGTQARQSLKDNLPTLAAIVALRGLPENEKRAWSSEAVGAVLESIGRPHERLLLRDEHGYAEINAAAINADSARVVTGSDDGVVRIWDLKSHRQIAALTGSADSVPFVKFSPDGKRVVAGAQILDALSGHKLADLLDGKGSFDFAEFSPDGHIIISGGQNDNALHVWDAFTGKLLSIFEGHNAPVRYINFNKNGTRLASISGDGTVKLWELPSGRQITSVIYDAKRYQQLIEGRDIRTEIYTDHYFHSDIANFSDDGFFLVAPSGSGTASIIDARSGVVNKVLRGHKRNVNFATMSQDGARIVTASDDGSAIVFDSKSGKKIATLDHRNTSVTSAQFCQDGKRVVTTAKGGSVRLWTVSTATNNVIMKGQYANTSGDASVKVFGNCEKIISAYEQGSEIHLYNDHTNDIQTLFGHSHDISGFEFDKRGDFILTASRDGTARVWDVSSDKKTIGFVGHKGHVWSAAMSPDGQLVVTASEDKTARIWDARTGKNIAILTGNTEDVISARFSHDQNFVVTTSNNGSILIFNAESRKLFASFRARSGAVYTKVEFSKDSKRALVVGNSSAFIIDLIKNVGDELRADSFCKECTVISGTFDDDGRAWLLFSDFSLRQLDRHGRSLASTNISAGCENDEHNSEFKVAFSPDSKFVIMHNYFNACVFNARSGQLIAQLDGYGRRSNMFVGPAVSMSKNGKYIAAGLEDGAIGMWDVSSGKMLYMLRLHEGRVTSLDFSEDSSKLISSSGYNPTEFLDGDIINSDDSVRIFDIVSATEIAILRGDSIPVYCAMMAPDGEHVLFASGNSAKLAWIGRSKDESISYARDNVSTGIAPADDRRLYRSHVQF